jgi:hypothetical protein
VWFYVSGIKRRSPVHVFRSQYNGGHGVVTCSNRVTFELSIITANKEITVEFKIFKHTSLAMPKESSTLSMVKVQEE